MTATPSPTPEEIEASARAIHEFESNNRLSYTEWDDLLERRRQTYRDMAEAALKAAMAVRRGK